MSAKHYLKVFKQNWRRKEWWTGSVYPYVRKRSVLLGLKPYYLLTDNNACNFMKEDWDNLVILDGCRFDMYEESNIIDGRLEHRISPGCSTNEFLSKTFTEETYHDTVYVTANPQIALRLDDDIFHDVIHVWKTAWDDGLETVRPEPMTEMTIKAHDEYPNKRIISHYIQPHYPFIGTFAQEHLGEQSGVGLSKRLADGEAAERTKKPVWEKLRDGEVSREVVWDAYVENLEVTMPHIRDLVNAMAGKTVITSDHGNLLGERYGLLPMRFYGHPTGIRAKNLVKVPWHVIEGDTRKRIVSEEATDTQEFEDDVVNERLESLGYV